MICGETHSLGGDVFTCDRAAGHEGFHAGTFNERERISWPDKKTIAAARVEKVESALDSLRASAVLNQDAFDENVSVTVPIETWREFWSKVESKP